MFCVGVFYREVSVIMVKFACRRAAALKHNTGTMFPALLVFLLSAMLLLNTLLPALPSATAAPGDHYTVTFYDDEIARVNNQPLAAYTGVAEGETVTSR